uniref:Uncharacterized protein n=1 Tax=Anopheles dirus TaxID=7168 RepID=A0A182NDQ0_9DIPT
MHQGQVELSCPANQIQQFSVDGLPLFKSTKMQAWPILMKVEELVGAPIMMVAMFCGTSKPNNLEPFLRTLVDEANDLQRRGLQFPGKLVKFQVRAFVADSPARAFLKATTSFNGLHGCLKCSCVGEYLTKERKTYLAVYAKAVELSGHQKILMLMVKLDWLLLLILLKLDEPLVKMKLPCCVSESDDCK